MYVRCIIDLFRYIDNFKYCTGIESRVKSEFIYLCRYFPPMNVDPEYFQTNSTSGIFRFAQDTVLLKPRSDTVKADTSIVKRYTQEQALQILLTQEKRTRAIDSINRANLLLQQREKLIVAEPEAVIDSSQHILFDSLPGLKEQQNVFSGIHRTDSMLSLVLEASDSTDTIISGTSEVLLPEKGLLKDSGKEYHYDWVLIVLLVSLGLFAWLRLFYNRLFKPVLISLLDYRESLKLFRDHSALFDRFSFFLNLLFYVNSGLFFFFVLKHYGIDIPVQNPFLIFVAVTVAMVLIYAGRYIICRLTGFISLSQNVFSEYTHNIFIINKNIGLFLFPLVIGIPYLPEGIVPFLIYGGLLLVGMGYMIRLWRAFQIFILNGFSIFYLILYLCALEFVPITVAVKYLQVLA